MPTPVTWNSTPYSIPAAGELNWSALSSFLLALGQNAQTTNFQLVGMRVATTTPVTVQAASDCVVVTNLAAPGAVAVNLPAGVNGQYFIIVDGLGDAATNNITVTPAAGNINGSATYVINRDRGGVFLAYNGTEWTILSEYTGQLALSVTGSTGSPLAVVGANGITSVPSALRNTIFVEGSGGAVDVVAATPIAAGSYVGQILTVVGCSDANTVRFNHTAAKLLLNGDKILGQYDSMHLMWDGTEWFELGAVY